MELQRRSAEFVCYMTCCSLSLFLSCHPLFPASAICYKEVCLCEWSLLLLFCVATFLVPFFFVSERGGNCLNERDVSPVLGPEVVKVCWLAIFVDVEIKNYSLAKSNNLGQVKYKPLLLTINDDNGVKLPYRTCPLCATDKKAHYPAHLTTYTRPHAQSTWMSFSEMASILPNSPFPQQQQPRNIQE